MFNYKKKNSEFFLSKEATFDGEVNTRGIVVLAGKLSGKINTIDDVLVDNSAKVDGEIAANNIVVNGSIEGVLDSVETTKVGEHGKVVGNIICKAFETAEGSIFRGKLQIK